MACLPALLVLQMKSLLFSCASEEEDGDPGVRPSSPRTDFDTSPFAEALLRLFADRNSDKVTDIPILTAVE